MEARDVYACCHAPARPTDIALANSHESRLMGIVNTGVSGDFLRPASLETTPALMDRFNVIQQPPVISPIAGLPTIRRIRHYNSDGRWRRER